MMEVFTACVEMGSLGTAAKQVRAAPEVTLQVGERQTLVWSCEGTVVYE